MRKTSCLILILIFLFAFSAYATDYYVATNGNDNNPGTEASPWLTPSKAAKTAVAGDNVYFKAGVYKPPFIPQNSGTSEDYITFTNYQNDEVIIDGSYEVTGWSVHSGSIYKASWDSTYLDAQHVAISGSSGFVVVDTYYNWLKPKTSVGEMVAGSWYYDKNNDKLYVWLSDSSNPSGHTVWSTKSYSKSARGIWVAGESYLKFEGFKIRLVYSGVSADETVGGAQYVEFKDIETYSVHTGFRHHYNNNYLTMDDVYVHHTIGPGIQLNSNYSTLKNSTIYMTGMVSWQRWGNAGIVVLGGHNTVQYNKIIETGYNSTFGPGIIFESWAYDPPDTSHHNVVEYNYIEPAKSSFYGIYFMGGDNNVVRGNVVVGGRGGVYVSIGGTAAGLTDAQKYSEYNEIYNNTFVDGATVGIEVRGDHVTDLTIKNNIIANTDKFIYVKSGSESEVTSDYNDFYLGNGWNWGGSTYTTLSAYQSGSGQEANSIDDDPNFADLGNKDFSLAEDSPCIDKGTTVGWPYEGQAPDIGAIESGVAQSEQPSSPESGVAQNEQPSSPEDLKIIQ